MFQLTLEGLGDAIAHLVARPDTYAQVSAHMTRALAESYGAHARGIMCILHSSGVPSAALPTRRVDDMICVR